MEKLNAAWKNRNSLQQHGNATAWSMEIQQHGKTE